MDFYATQPWKKNIRVTNHLGPGRMTDPVARQTQKPDVPCSIFDPAIYFRFSFR